MYSFSHEIMWGGVLMLRMRGGRGTARISLWGGNYAGLWFFVIKRVLVGEAYRMVADDVVEVVLRL